MVTDRYAALAAYTFVIAAVISFLSGTLLWEIAGMPLASLACFLLGGICLVLMLEARRRDTS